LLVCFPEQFLRALDPEFVAAATAVRVLSCGLLVSQAAGPLGALLVMSGRPKQALYFVVAGASAFTLLSLYAIPAYGLVGVAASATAVAIVLVPCISAYVRRTVGVGIYGRALWKPAAAAVVALAVASAVAAFVPAWRAIDAAAIACAATAVYVALLAAFGVEPEERAVLADLHGVLGKLKRVTGRR
jgi:O-antigen/teichoic acid export membrane protein